MEQKREMRVAIRAAKKAGKKITEDFRQPKEILFKDVHNIVTHTDVFSETLVLDILRKAFPRDSYFSEECGPIHGDHDRLWVLDPLDGTTNFGKGIPHFCISLALCVRKEPVIGVVYQPITKDLFYAEKRCGAYCNGNRIWVSDNHDLLRTVMVVNRGGTREEKLRVRTLFYNLVTEVRSIRILGATALDLCYIASGRLDGMVNSGCEYYDCAAGNLILQEAGGIVTDFKGVPWQLLKSDLLATTPALHRPLCSLLSRMDL